MFRGIAKCLWRKKVKPHILEWGIVVTLQCLCWWCHFPWDVHESRCACYEWKMFFIVRGCISKRFTINGQRISALFKLKDRKRNVQNSGKLSNKMCFKKRFKTRFWFSRTHLITASWSDCKILCSRPGLNLNSNTQKTSACMGLKGQE